LGKGKRYVALIANRREKRSKARRGACKINIKKKLCGKRTYRRMTSRGRRESCSEVKGQSVLGEAEFKIWKENEKEQAPGANQDTGTKGMRLSSQQTSAAKMTGKLRVRNIGKTSEKVLHQCGYRWEQRGGKKRARSE